ncbi:hypothetical protein, partial [Parvibacter caecicola]|uniref:hypothetical protein n=1 Tax=Parvibacter caecicola TaxID=747645 RepID=UPI0023F1F210
AGITAWVQPLLYFLFRAAVLGEGATTRPLRLPHAPILALQAFPSRIEVRSAGLQGNYGHLGNPQLLA